MKWKEFVEKVDAEIKKLRDSDPTLTDNPDVLWIDTGELTNINVDIEEDDTISVM